MNWYRVSIRAGVACVATCGIVGIVFAARLPADLDLTDRGLESSPVDITADTTRHKGDSAPAMPRSEHINSGNPLWALPLSSLASTRDRPIFSPSRRPPPPVIAAPHLAPVNLPVPKRPEPDHPLLTLLGTIAGETEGIGIFINEIDKTPLRLKTGQDHDGWVLRTVRGRDAIFEKDNRGATLSLPPRGSAESAAAAGAALCTKRAEACGWTAMAR